MDQYIIDGDWGSDEMLLAAVLLNAPEHYKILGATSCFGNAPVKNCTENARRLLHFLGAPHIEVFQGAASPTNEPAPVGDDAHGHDGIGGVHLPLPRTTAPRPAMSAVDFILETLRVQPAHSVTITATGPLTNIAQAFAKDPNTMRRVKQIIIMGGCLRDIPAKDRPTRRGNITPHAEFNFYMAPQDANTVLASGLPITLAPMECTQQLAFTTENRMQLNNALRRDPIKMNAVRRLTCVSDAIDQEKFGSKQFLHDVHCALIALHPELYETRVAGVHVSTDDAMRGFSSTSPFGSVRVATELKDPKRAFNIVCDSLQQRLITPRFYGR